jgi:hypothetical protein
MNGPAPARRISPWGALVAFSAVLVVGAAAALLIAAVASSRERDVRFAVRGSLSGVTLDVGDADVEIRGGGPRELMQVRRIDHYAFGHGAVVSRSVLMGEMRLRSRCPGAMPRACSSRFELVVPDNVPVDVRTDGGAVRLRGYHGSAQVTTRGGDIDVAGFCGFALEARAESGDIATSAACAPQRLALRSTEGSVTASVPPGRYQVEAESTNGAERVSGVSAVSDAPFSVQALSSSGDVVVEGRR